MHMMWLLPQYIILTCGEILFSITGLEFAYTQSPASMKAVVQALYLLTTAGGNLIDWIVVAALSPYFKKQVSQLQLSNPQTIGPEMEFAATACPVTILLDHLKRTSGQWWWEWF